MAEAVTKTKKTKVLSEESRKRKRESDKVKGRTRINIGRAFARWCELKEEEGCPTDADLAVMLLDYYQTRQVTSTPSKAHIHNYHSCWCLALLRIVIDDIPVQGVQLLDTQEVGVLEASIDMDERWTKQSFCEDGDSSDEDYVPFLQIRYVLEVKLSLNSCHEISVDEAVIDVAMPTFPEDDVSDIPDSYKVVCEDDIVSCTMKT
ncbi:unnamed protein product [Leuciscus chuanchicus]